MAATDDTTSSPADGGGPLRISGGTSAEQWRVVQHLLATRAGHRCEACGQRFIPGVREPSIHHRRNRGAGGTSRPSVRDLPELLLLCAGFARRMGGVLGCHGAITTGTLTGAVARGLVVGKYTDPAQVPVVLASGRRVLLDPLGPFYLPAPGTQYATP